MRGDDFSAILHLVGCSIYMLDDMCSLDPAAAGNRTFLLVVDFNGLPVMARSLQP